MELTTVWFILIAILWVGYLVLEGFDFGVGILLPVIGRNEPERRAMIRTIGPVWDGNEVWLLVAGGATFAAFPEWYATLFSGFYIALFAILVALIFRGIAIEYRNKRPGLAWRTRWDWAIAVGSFVPALLWGVAFANIVQGVPIDADKEFTGTFFTLLNPYALVGGATTLLLFVTHGAHFLALKTEGGVRDRANRIAAWVGLAAAVAAVVFLGWTLALRGNPAAVATAIVARSRAGRRHPRQPRASRGLGVPGHDRHDRPGRRDPVRRPLPGRHAVVDRPGLQPDGDERLLDRVHAHDHDRRGGPLRSHRPDLPGVDLLGLPQARHGPAGDRRALIPWPRPPAVHDSG